MLLILYDSIELFLVSNIGNNNSSCSCTTLLLSCMTMSRSTVLNPIIGATFSECPICERPALTINIVKHFRKCFKKTNYDRRKFIQCPGSSLHLLDSHLRFQVHLRTCPDYEEALEKFLGPEWRAETIGGDVSSPDPYNEGAIFDRYRVLFIGKFFTLLYVVLSHVYAIRPYFSLHMTLRPT